ncbi:hypothetical protein CRUP_026567 [Coryphaenoides rupestris]|nr:hypothetical protein CRUP_026567 [Coryphaenoides rupestris]
MTRLDKEHARSRGWWEGNTAFNFAKAYSYMATGRIEASDTRYCEGKKMMDNSKGHITAQTMMGILRDKESGINMEGAFMTTASMVSVVPRDPTLPGVHYFPATPDPESANDPVKQKPEQARPEAPAVPQARSGGSHQ